MVLKSDQQRIRELLSQAIPMMCKNGLAFKTEFCIEALIGITLDNDDVFLVNIKETFQNEDDDEGGGKEGVVSSGTAAAISSPTKKRSKKRRSSSEANGSPTAADIKQEENEQELRQSHESDRESVSKRRRHGDGSNTGKSSDVVVIKDEPTSDNELEAALWMHDNDPPHGVYSEQMQNLMTGSFSGETSRTYADQQHLPGSSGDPNEQDFITYAAPESEGLSQFRPSPGRSKPPPTGASSAMAQISSHEPVDSNSGPISCQYCGESFRRKHYLEDHVIGVHSLIKRFTCGWCGERFRWRSGLSAHRKKKCLMLNHDIPTLSDDVIEKHVRSKKS